MATTAHPTAPPLPLQTVPPPGAPPVEAAADWGESPLARFSIHPEAVVAHLPIEVEVGVPVRGFRVRNLLALEPGTLVASQWGHGDDLPLCARDVQLAWTEFEVVVGTLAVRITRIA
jgi:hypothetical protein